MQRLSGQGPWLEVSGQPTATRGLSVLQHQDPALSLRQLLSQTPWRSPFLCSLPQDKLAKAHGAPSRLGGTGSAGQPPPRGQGPAAPPPRKTEAWLVEGLTVKVMSPGLKAHGYYKEKGLVLRVLDKYIGEVELFSSGAGARGRGVWGTGGRRCLPSMLGIT